MTTAPAADPGAGGAWTTPDHVRIRYEGTLAPDQDPRLWTWIGDAERILAGHVSDLAARVTSGAVDVREVQRIVAQAVIRHLRNPSGITQRSTAEGPFTTSVSYTPGADPGTGIAFTADELDDLRAPGRPPGFGVAWSDPSPRWAGFGPLYDRHPGAER